MLNETKNDSKKRKQPEAECEPRQQPKREKAESKEEKKKQFYVKYCFETDEPEVWHTYEFDGPRQVTVAQLREVVPARPKHVADFVDVYSFNGIGMFNAFVPFECHRWNDVVYTDPREAIWAYTEVRVKYRKEEAKDETDAFKVVIPYELEVETKRAEQKHLKFEEKRAARRKENETKKYQRDYDEDDGKCPFCHEAWDKFEECLNCMRRVCPLCVEYVDSARHGRMTVCPLWPKGCRRCHTGYSDCESDSDDDYKDYDTDAVTSEKD